MVMRGSGRVVGGLVVAVGLVGSGLVLSSASASGPMVTEFTTGLTAGGVPNAITEGPTARCGSQSSRPGRSAA